MKRKPGDLVPAERTILEMAIELCRQGKTEFHGYQIAKAIEAGGKKRYLSGYGILYRALERLEEQGFLTSYWEETDSGDNQKPPRRRFYRLTGKPAPASVNVAPDSVPINCVLERATP